MSNVTISALPTSATLTGVELMELVQAGVSSKTTIATILASRLAVIPQFITATGNYNASIFDSIIADTSSASLTITLPASPAYGNVIWFIDGAGTWNTNNLTINGNGTPILNNSGNLIVTTARDNFSLVYYNSVQGWILGD